MGMIVLTRLIEHIWSHRLRPRITQTSSAWWKHIMNGLKFISASFKSTSVHLVCWLDFRRSKRREICSSRNKVADWSLWQTYVLQYLPTMLFNHPADDFIGFFIVITGHEQEGLWFPKLFHKVVSKNHFWKRFMAFIIRMKQITIWLNFIFIFHGHMEYVDAGFFG